MRAALVCCLIGAAAGTTAITVLVLNWHEGHVQRLAESRSKAKRADDLAATRVVETREELDRRTGASVNRDRRALVWSRLLLGSMVLFLVGAKWRLSLVGNRPPSKEAARGRGRHDPKGSRDPASTHRVQAPGPACGGGDCELDLGGVDEIIARVGRRASDTVPLLQAIQAEYRYLPERALQYVSASTDIPPARLMSVATFYPQFRHEPAGAHVVRVCRGTACHVAGADLLDHEMRRYLGIAPGDDTDPFRRFTIEPVACLGCCTRAPVVQIDEKTYGPLSIEDCDEVLDEVEETAGEASNGREQASTAIVPASGGKPVCEVRVGMGSCCVAGGSGAVFEEITRAIERAGGQARVKRVGCVGMCHQTPLVQIMAPDGGSALYAGVAPGDVRSVLRPHMPVDGWRPRLANLFDRGRDLFGKEDRARRVAELRITRDEPKVAAFLSPQRPIATEHGGAIDPGDCDEYLRHEGFAALQRCLRELTPDAVIESISQSELRGRGGAGFPVGQKWRRVHDADGSHKVVIANGDEGDPGAFMDRMLMESFPFRIIEGLAIAAYAVGASRGVLYIRAEYPLAVKRIREAIGQCETRGLLSRGMFGTDFELRLEIFEGAGAFVCGEETALIASVEGRRGTPRWRPPYPAQRGLDNAPTLVNNVETLANLPWIIRHGPDAFAAMGTARSKGTKVFALAGKVRRGGLIEVPMGMTIREIVEDIGGGVMEDRTFKAVQIGGPSGGCIPAALADTPVDYEALTEVGAIMGSGGLVVMDEFDCMVDIARYFVEFTQSQSCGRCVPCRVGTRQMLDILDRLCEGRAKRGDLERLEELAGAVQLGSLCGLGRTAPNPVQTTLRYFREEYEAHLRGECPAGKCTALIGYAINDKCIGCTLCAQHCPVDAIEYRPYEMHDIDLDRCTRCGICKTTCPEDAVEVMTSCHA